MNILNSKRFLSECFGTFALVFSGTGAIVINDVTGGSVAHIGVAAERSDELRTRAASSGWLCSGAL